MRKDIKTWRNKLQFIKCVVYFPLPYRSLSLSKRQKRQGIYCLFPTGSTSMTVLQYFPSLLSKSQALPL